METIQFLCFSMTTEQLTMILKMIQILGIFIPVISIVVILQKEQSKSATYLMLANAACSIVNCSYLMILEMDNAEALTTAYRMEYVGISLFFFFFILFMMEYQHMRCSRVVSIGWPLFELIEIPQMWMRSATHVSLTNEETEFVDATQNTSEALTQSVPVGGNSGTGLAANGQHMIGEMGKEWMGDMHIALDDRIGMYRVNMDGGLLYDIRYGLIATMLLLMLIYTIYRFVKTPNKTERHNLFHLMAAQTFLEIMWLFSRFSDVPFDIVPIASSVVICVMTLSVMVGEFFTVTDQGRNWVFEHTNDVFLIADDAYGYLDANRYAKTLFPELRRYHKNEALPENVLHLFQTDADEVELDGHFYERRVATLYQNEKRKKKVAGYSLILVDVTKQLQLVQAAEEANEAKSAFLSNMSHEIRTPMNAIVGMTEIMLRTEVTEEQAEYLSNIKVSGDSLLNIINDILDFSKIESGKMELVEEDYAPMSMISDLGIMFLTRIGEKNIELLYDIDPALPKTLHGDGLRVRQIMINILNNAVKFTETGYVKLSIAVEEKTDADLLLAVRIRDTGSGIRGEDQKKLFQSFSQVDSRKNHSKEGTGLGLAICRQLVEMMGGEIGVSSTYGEGSEFYFTIRQKIAEDIPAAYLPEKKTQWQIGGAFANPYLQENFEQLVRAYGIEPIAPETMEKLRPHVDFFFTDTTNYEKYKDVIHASMLEDKQICVLQNPVQESLRDAKVMVVNKPLYSLNFCQAIRREQQVAYAGSADELNFKAPDAKILLVDDNKMNLKVAIGLLAPLQMQIDTAENGKQAIEKIETCTYDLVFMDHMMPIMDGVEATRRIREKEEETGAHLTIIALTADAMSGAKEEFMAAGMDDFVAKPIEIKEICSKLRKYLPQDKIVKTEECLLVAEETDDLPQIEGLDVEAGVHYSGSRALFFNLLGDYYKLIDTKTKKIRQCLSDGMIRDLTIEVHALKNTSRMIGATGLSERFKELEALGNANDGKALEEKVPEVLELYAGYKSVLQPYGTVDEASLQETSKDELCRLLIQMADAMDGFDLDGVDAAMAELEQYRMPEELSDDMDALRAAVADVAMEEVIAKSHAMADKLQNEKE